MSTDHFFKVWEARIYHLVFIRVVQDSRTFVTLLNHLPKLYQKKRFYNVYVCI